MSDQFAGEIMKTASMLLKTKGNGALEHAQNISERMQKSGDEEDQIYWKRIVMQIEALIEGGHG